MPASHRRNFIWKAAREAFEKNRHLERAEDVSREFTYGVCMLDQAEEQQKHLQMCKEQGLLMHELLPGER